MRLRARVSLSAAYEDVLVDLGPLGKVRCIREGREPVRYDLAARLDPSRTAGAGPHREFMALARITNEDAFAESALRFYRAWGTPGLKGLRKPVAAAGYLGYENLVFLEAVKGAAGFRYREPLPVLRAAASALDAAILDLGLVEPLPTRSREARSTLESMMAGARPGVFPEGDAFADGWIAEDLITAMALLASDDLRRGLRDYLCDHCGKRTASTRPGALYCSLRCRKAVQMRRYRSELDQGSR